jgi:hypothetical protein
MYPVNDTERGQLVATAFWLCVDEFLKLEGTPAEARAAVAQIKGRGAKNLPPTLDAVFAIAGLLNLSPETMVISIFELLAPDGCPNPYGHQIERIYRLGWTDSGGGVREDDSTSYVTAEHAWQAAEPLSCARMAQGNPPLTWLITYKLSGYSPLWRNERPDPR